MKIILENTRCTVAESTDAEDAWLDDELKWKDPSKRHNQYYKGDGFIHLYDQINGTFPSGFLRQVVDSAKMQGVRLQIADKRVRPSAPPDPAEDLTWLRDYQLEAVQETQKRARGVLWCPTGSGKTEIACGLAKSVPVRWLFLAHRKELVLQAAARFEKRTGEKAGVVGDGKWDVQRFTAATFQTIHAGLKKQDQKVEALLTATEGLMIDEVHTLPANTFLRVVNRADNAFYRVGLSGTPLQREDEKSMHIIGACGPVIYRIPAQVLIDAGVLAKPKIRMVSCYQTIKLPPAKSSRMRAKLWAKASAELITESEERNRLVTKLAGMADKPCLVFVQQIQHGNVLAKRMQEAGMRVEFVNGNKATPQRMAAIQRLERGDIDVLICTVIFNEGVDIPELRSVVLASAGKSAIAALQRVGRGMRKVAGKKEFEVWDILDEGNLLEKHARKRARAYGIEGYEVEEIENL